MQISDDKQVALVEFIARDQKAFAPILTSRRSDVRTFLKGRNSKAEIDTEFRKFKKDFDLDRFGVDLQ